MSGVEMGRGINLANQKHNSPLTLFGQNPPNINT